MKLFEIFGTVKVDTRPAEEGLANVDNKGKQAGRTFDDLSSKAVGLADKLNSMGKKLTKFGGDMTKKVTLPIVAAGTASFMFAADLEDAMGASDQIFKNSSDEIKGWADNLETYYGIAEGEALTYANTMGSMLKNIGGLSEAEAAKTSQTLVELAGDLTAMFGGTTESAVLALTGALKGNNSMLDNYGMGVNDATVKTKALEMGLMGASASSADLTKANLDIEKAQIKYNKALEEHGSQSLEARDASNKLELAKQKLTESSEKVTGTLSLEAKQAATLALIMEQTGDAQGQAAREADGASGSLRSLITELKNLSTEVGEILLPIITPMIVNLREMAERFGELSPGTQKAIVTLLGLVAVIGPAILVIGKMMTTVSTLITVFTTVSGAISSAGGIIALLTNPIGIAIAAIAAIIAIGVALYKNWDNIMNFGSKLKDGLVNTWNSLSESTKQKFKDIGAGMIAPFKAAWDAIKKVVDKVKEAFKFDIKFPKIKAPKWLAKVIPSLADDYDGPEANPDGKPEKTKKTKAGKKFFAKGGYVNRATEFARVGGVSHVAGEAGGEGIVPLEGKHMRPMAAEIARMLKDDKGSGTQVNNEFNIASLVVREEADIRRIAEELEALTIRKNRLRGAY